MQCLIMYKPKHSWRKSKTVLDDYKKVIEIYVKVIANDLQMIYSLQ